MDWRNIRNGIPVPTEPGYSDQPSVVETAEGNWLLCITTGRGQEGAAGQYVAITRSEDQGKSWSSPVPMEDPEWESAYGTLACAPGGRVFCFYCYNLHRVDSRKLGMRYDMGGAFVFRYTDDEGRTWSQRREIPVPMFVLDEEAPDSLDGTPLRFFWNVSRPFFHKGSCYVPLIHYVPVGQSILGKSEGSLLCCEGLEENPDAVWRTCPEGSVGIRTPEGGDVVAEEQSFVTLSDDTLFCTFRTIDGRPAYAVSRDNGVSFEPSRWLSYASGEIVKHSRAATFIWPLGNQKYLYWLHNVSRPQDVWRPRNPVWVSLAEETDTPEGKNLLFHSPEIFLYDPDPAIGISYPHLFQSKGKWYVSETDKVTARIHPVAQEMLDALGKTEAPVRKPVWFASEHFEINSRGGMTLLVRWKGNTDGILLQAEDLQVEVLNGKLAWRYGSTNGSTPIGAGGEHAAALRLDFEAHIGYAVTDGCYRMNPLYQRDYEWLDETVLRACRVRLDECVTEACAWDEILTTAQMEYLTR